MKLFHGSYETKAPIVKVGSFALGSSDNIFDGIFASDCEDIAGSHGNNVFAYEVEGGKIADSHILNENIDKIICFLRSELDECNDENTLEEIAYAIADDECDDSFAEFLSPRSCTGDAGWEMQRIRGRVAANLGFDAIEMEDEHGTSYLIVNPEIVSE